MKILKTLFENNFWSEKFNNLTLNLKKRISSVESIHNFLIATCKVNSQRQFIDRVLGTGFDLFLHEKFSHMKA